MGILRYRYRQISSYQALNQLSDLKIMWRNNLIQQKALPLFRDFFFSILTEMEEFYFAVC